MEMIARQADEKIREGIELADRGANFAARADFITALRLLAQGLDNDEGGARHSQALSAALTAMKEAQDFLPAPGKVEGEMDLSPIIAAHRTPLLKNAPTERLQAMRAMKQYFNFAQEQLCLAVGPEVAGSMALRSLGKLHAAMSDKAVPEVTLPEAQAITFFQAAMLVCPRNYMAANDLGVLLAHKNDFAAARAALEHSVRVCPCAENLRNLSVVYRQLGDLRSAELAGRDADAAKAAELARQRSSNRSAGGAVQWVDPSVIARPTGQWNDLPARPAAGSAPQGGAAAGAAMGQPATPTVGPTLR
jgi:tetratricopeptide (TPR) repeat protein